MGPKPFKRLASVYDGFYVFKYDLKGNLQWKSQQKAPKTLADYAAFRIHSTPELRNIALRFGNDNSINFSVQTRKLLAVFALNGEGKGVRNIFDNNFVSSVSNVYLPLSASKSEAYVKKFASKKKAPNFYLYVLADRDLLLERPFDGAFSDQDRLLIFKK
jgi:myo-inositol-hexaphosphate 3-phosphohydrolase